MRFVPIGTFGFEVICIYDDCSRLVFSHFILILFGKAGEFNIQVNRRIIASIPLLDVDHRILPFFGDEIVYFVRSLLLVDDELLSKIRIFLFNLIILITYCLLLIVLTFAGLLIRFVKPQKSLAEALLLFFFGVPDLLYHFLPLIRLCCSPALYVFVRHFLVMILIDPEVVGGELVLLVVTGAVYALAFVNDAI